MLMVVLASLLPCAAYRVRPLAGAPLPFPLGICTSRTPRRHASARSQLSDTDVVRDLSGDDGVLFQQLKPPPAKARKFTSGNLAFNAVHVHATVLDGPCIVDTRNQGNGSAVELQIISNAPGTAMVPGFELALPLMRVGEIARITCAPRYAFGEEGVAELVPPHATVQFDVELISVRDLRDDEDLFSSEDPSAEGKKDDVPDNVAKYMFGADTKDPSIAVLDSRFGVAKPSHRNFNPPEGEESKASQNVAAKETTPPSDQEEVPQTQAVEKPINFVPRGRPWLSQPARIEMRHPSGWRMHEGAQEIDVRVPLALGTTKDSISVKFAKNSISVVVGNEVKMEGTLTGMVQASDCAWTINDTFGGGLELQLDLMKHPSEIQNKSKKLWGYLFEEDFKAAENVDPIKWQRGAPAAKGPA